MSRAAQSKVRWLFLALLAACMLTIGRAQAEPTEPEQAVAGAREALEDGSNPWYDSETDSLKVMTFERRERGNPLQWLWDLLGLVLKWVAYLALGLVLAAIVVLLIWFAINVRRGRKLERKPKRDDAVQVLDQVEALPFMAERSRDDLLGQARRHYEQGNYSEAIIYLFSYELLELDKFSRIHLAKGKTNRQYLRELAGAQTLRSPLERTLLAFESVFFGRRPLDRGGFEACWNELPQFEAQLRGAT